MNRRKLSAKTKKKISKWIASASLLSLVISIYMLFVSPTKRDIRRIENLVRARTGQTQVTTPIWIPEGIKTIDNAELDKLEKDIARVESSIFFRLSSETYLDISTFYFNQAKFKKALEYVDKSILKSPLNSKSLSLRSILHLYAGSLPEAIADANAILERSSEQLIKGGAQFVKGYVSSLSGDLHGAKDSLIKAADIFLLPGKPKELLVFSYFLIAETCFDLGEYDSGDYYFSKCKEATEHLDTQNNKDPLVIIVLAIVNYEGELKNLVDNYDKFLKLKDESIFHELMLYLYKAAISINDYEAFSSYIENAIQFSKKYDIAFLEQLFRNELFEYSMDSTKSFRKDLWEEVFSSPAKIPSIEADMYLAAGKFYYERKENESALSYLNNALERFTTSNRKKDIVNSKILIYFVQSDLKDYYSSSKILRSALEDINAIFAQNNRKSYLSSRAREEVDELRVHKDGIERILPVMDKLLR